MSRPLRSWLRLVRIPLAPTAACDSGACALLALAAARVAPGTWQPLDWLALAVTSIAIYATGMAANDVADRTRDATLYPDRPLPSGAIRPAAAWLLIAGTAAVALALGGGPRGERLVVLAALGLAALYDFRTKSALVPGALSMGAVRFANASIAVWPLVLSGAAPAWTLAGPASLGIYSAGVTVLSTTEEGDAPRRLAAARVLGFVACAVAGAVTWLAAGIFTIGVAWALFLCSSIGFGVTPRKGPAKKQVLEMLLGLYFVAAVLATAGDRGSLAFGLAALAGAYGLVYVTQVMIRALGKRPAA